MADEILLKILDSQLIAASRMGSLEASVASIIGGIEMNRDIHKETRDKVDSIDEQVGHLHICMERRVGRLERNWKMLITAASAVGAIVAAGFDFFKDRINAFVQ